MSPLSALPASPAPTADRAGIAKAAQGFEAMLLRQMLAAARQSSFDSGLFSSEAMGTFRQMQDDRMADLAAESGGFGFARAIEAQLARQIGGGT